jgi:hypothetical protein
MMDCSFLCYQGEIDAREDSFVSCADAGERLVNSNHYAADEVSEKVWEIFAFLKIFNVFICFIL